MQRHAVKSQCLREPSCIQIRVDTRHWQPLSILLVGNATHGISLENALKAAVKVSVLVITVPHQCNL